MDTYLGPTYNHNHKFINITLCYNNYIWINMKVISYH